MKKNDNPFSIEQLDDNTGFLLWQISSIWQLKQKKALEANYDITHTQYVLLASIYWLTLHNEEVTQISLSLHTKIEPMTISQVLKALQKKGYIFRQPHSKDTRAKAVYLTEDGKNLMKKAVITIEDIDTRFFEVLGKNVRKFNIQIQKLIKDNF